MGFQIGFRVHLVGFIRFARRHYCMYEVMNKMAISFLCKIIVLRYFGADCGVSVTFQVKRSSRKPFYSLVSHAERWMQALPSWS